jgi:hypothetical protein
MSECMVHPSIHHVFRHRTIQVPFRGVDISLYIDGYDWGISLRITEKHIPKKNRGDQECQEINSGLFIAMPLYYFNG